MKRILYVMLIAAPVAVVLDFFFQASVSPLVVFVLSCIGLIPLADFIGEATEELAHYTGPRLGGLLNATLGNAAELIITLFAIQRGLLDLVKASITGSIIGNLLLVLGLSLLLGGLKNGTQTFDRRTAGMNATLLILAVIALAIPSLFDAALVSVPESELLFNEGVAVVLLVLYVLALVYSFQRGKGGHSDAAAPGDVAQQTAEAQHKARWSWRFALAVLIGATLGTALVSEVLVGAVEPVVAQFGITEFFLGIIIIPLVGNIAEHLVAVEVAYKNKMELSLAVSLGSSLQIALLVAPVLVFASLLFNQRLLLVFTPYELAALGGTALIAAFIAQDGESSWLEGAMLLAVYLIIGLAFFFLPAATVSVH